MGASDSASDSDSFLEMDMFTAGGGVPCCLQCHVDLTCFMFKGCFDIITKCGKTNDGTVPFLLFGFAYFVVGGLIITWWVLGYLFDKLSDGVFVVLTSFVVLACGLPCLLIDPSKFGPACSAPGCEAGLAKWPALWIILELLQLFFFACSIAILCLATCCKK